MLGRAERELAARPNLATVTLADASPTAPEITHVIGGEFLSSTNGETFESIDPHDGSVVVVAPRGTVDDAKLAVSVARRAFDEGPWPRMSTGERAKILHRLADLLEEHVDELALLETRDTGRPLAHTIHYDVQRAAANFRFFADYADLAANESYSSDGRLSYVLYPPAGVVVAISPWNLPLMLSTWKIAPALAFGDTVVLKPAEQTPSTATRLAELALEAGLPEGVLNVVHGFGPGEVGEALTSDPRVDRITFTGASATGKAIMGAAARNLTPVSFELGGRSANVVFADADLDVALEGSLRAIFSNNGAMCLAGSRLLVQRSILDEFTARFVERARAMRVGDPKDLATDIGPLIEPAHLEKVQAYVDLAQEEGGELLCGGHPTTTAGPLHFPATVLGSMNNQMRSSRDEIFGPVQMIIPFEDERDALRIANDSEFGLAGMLWTNNLDRAHAMARQWETGTLWVNCFFDRDLREPFGGTGSSGVGREGGSYSREFFTEPRAVILRHRSELQ
ncbi:MAG: 5-carboxymethyl-2-hydroxymuconate semialdehyde dehydrogenase [Conexibacter sp.]|nr:5-carboxymethyl-2-hydroxymuconate semialdehyde dehydrogenase [Conexibacter sp.]